MLNDLTKLRFLDEDIVFLKNHPTFKHLMTYNFTEYLRNWRFEADVLAIPEGTIQFPGEPVLQITGDVISVQLVETRLLGIYNGLTDKSSLASRFYTAADGAILSEFGMRRDRPAGHEECVRAAYIAGFNSSSDMSAAKKYGIPDSGTMDHGWVMFHDTQVLAFKNFVKVFGNDNSIFLVDTYDTSSGIDDGISLFDYNNVPGGFRDDSGDLLAHGMEIKEKISFKLPYLNGENIKKVATNSLKEMDLPKLRPYYNVFGIGEMLYMAPKPGGVYKITENHNQVFGGKMKVAEGKASYPGVHQVY